MITKRFGLVGTYDGDAVKVGRVVVDSTWHHWFSFNLVGIAAQASTAFWKMQTYYRNVALWLTTPAQRFSMMVSGVWSTLTQASPEAFSPNDSPWQIGERVLARLRATTPEGMLDDWVAALLDPGLAAAIFGLDAAAESEPSWSSLPQEMVNRAVVGGVGAVDVERLGSVGGREGLDQAEAREVDEAEGRRVLVRAELAADGGGAPRPAGVAPEEEEGLELLDGVDGVADERLQPLGHLRHRCAQPDAVELALELEPLARLAPQHGHVA